MRIKGYCLPTGNDKLRVMGVFETATRVDRKYYVTLSHTNGPGVAQSNIEGWMFVNHIPEISRLVLTGDNRIISINLSDYDLRTRNGKSVRCFSGRLLKIFPGDDSQQPYCT